MPWIDGEWSDSRRVIESHHQTLGTRWLDMTGEWTKDVKQARIYRDEAEARPDMPPLGGNNVVMLRACRSHPVLRDRLDPACGGPVPSRGN